MPLEFALRPRIRLRDDFAAPPRRSRFRLPRFALPVLGYWLAIGGITYALVHAHDSADTAPLTDEPIAAAEPAVDVAALSPASEPEPAPVRAAAPLIATAAAEPAPTSEPPPPAADEPEPAGTTDAPRASRSATPREERRRERPLARAEENTLSADDIAPLSASLPTLEPPSAAAIAPPPSRARETSSGALPSCEAAAAAASQDLDFASSDRTADLPSSAIAGVLENGAWLSSCGVPAGTSLDVCVAIKGGRVTAATVISRPADSGLNACVKQRAAALMFPYSARVDIARTRF